MTVTTGFPRELLTRPSAERLAYFRAYTVAHPLLAETKEKLMASISESEPNSLAGHAPAAAGPNRSRS